MNIDNNIIEDFYKKSTSLMNLSSEELKLLKIIHTQLINNTKSNNLEISNKKIILNYKFMLDLAKKDLFKKQSFMAHNLTKKLVKHKLISRKSILYPKNIKFFSTNPLSKCFLNANMKTVDLFINIFNKFLLDYTLPDDVKLYIYLRLFYIKKLSKKEILLIDENSLIEVPNNSFLVIHEKIMNEDAYIPMKILFADENIKNIYNNFKKTKAEIFNKELVNYEYQLQKFLKINNLTYNETRISLEFVYQIKNTPLKLNLQKKTRYPKITLHEIDYIYPSSISKTLLEIEKKNIEKYFNTNKVDEEQEYLDTNDTVNEYIKNDLKEYDFLKTVLNFPTDDKNKYDFLEYWYDLLKDSKSDFEIINNISKYILFILKKADDREDKKIGRKSIKMSTARDYLSTTFKYAFNYIIAEGEINSKTISSINDNLLYNEKLTTKTISTYKRVINLFLLKFTNFNSLNKINSIVDVRRSIVFKNEFKNFVDSIYNADLEKYKLTKNSKTKSLMRSVFLILLYYSGLRKTELRTRLVIDIKRIGSSNEFTIDVNSEGFKEAAASSRESELKMKTLNAKRRVRFSITNKKHQEMVIKYLNWIEKHKYKFLFPLISEKNLILKKDVCKDSFFSELSLLLQKHTKRYTPLHSLRHTFATKYFLENIKLKNFQDIMYELANIMGHSDPETTIYNYIHFDLLNLPNEDLHYIFYFNS